MATVQSSYSDAITVGTPGMIANAELVNKISRTLEGDNLAFGLPVLRGSADNTCILASRETLEAASANGATAPAGATITAAPAVGAGAKPGVYHLTCITAGATGKWIVEDPDGIEIGLATTGTEFVGGGLTFTITDSGTDPAIGEQFIITVSPTEETDVGSFLGLSVRDTTLGAETDAYVEGDTVAVMTEGVMWVTAGAAVTPDDPVYWNPATGRYTKTTTHFAIPGAVYDSSGGNGDLVKVALR